MTIDTLQMRKEIEYCEEKADYHKALAAKSFEESAPIDSTFHAGAARLYIKHARNLAALMVILDYVEHIG